MPAAARLNASASANSCSTISGPIHSIAKNASTMLGIPASTSRIGLRMRRTLGFAYSARYAAAASPSGMAMTIATAVTRSEPMNSVRRSK